jgi:dephospho-CoA kinase
MSSRHRGWLLAGGIGSGKSTVRQLLEENGIATIDADSVGHEVLSEGGGAVTEVSALWPEVVVDGGIDRRRLGEVVFADPDALKRLEIITHPHIFSIIAARVDELGAPVVIELPVLTQPFGNPWPRIVVDAPDGLRMRRAVARGQTEEDVRKRMRSQPSRGEWLAAADMVIPNHLDLRRMEEAVVMALPRIRALPQL